MYHKARLLSLVAILCILLALSYSLETSAQTDTPPNAFVSPLPTPTPLPLSPLAGIAIRAIADIEQLPLAQLYFVGEEALGRSKKTNPFFDRFSRLT
jgi:hypothetical protein